MPVAAPDRPATNRRLDDRFVLRGVDWAFYDTVLKALDNRHVFVSYDRGSVEIMVPSPEHEGYTIMLGRLVEMLAFEMNVDIRSGGMTTFRRKDIERGLEPDRCYWIQNEARVDLLNYDVMRDPPPDLAIEIDVSRSAIDRESIYAKLGVPEVWCYDGKSLRVHIRRADGTYRVARKSRAFPFLPLEEFAGFIQMPPGTKENEWLRSFQKWVRTRLKK